MNCSLSVHSSGSLYTNIWIIRTDDPDTCPIVKGKLGKRMEFGYKVQIEEVEHGIVSGYKVCKGNPSYKELLEDVVVSIAAQESGRVTGSFPTT